MKLGPLVGWVSRMMAEQDGTPSSKRATYVGAFVTMTVALLGSLIKWGHTDIWNEAFAIYGGVFVLGYVGGKLADRGTNSPTPPPAP